MRAAWLLSLPLLAGCAGGDAALYRDYAALLAADGGLRDETAPADAPYTNADLATNFERIALNREYRREGEVLIQERTATRLSRWDEPVRWRIVGQGATAEDRSEFRALSTRLAAITGLDLGETRTGEPNLSILILRPDERRVFLAALTEDGATARMPLVARWVEEVAYPCIGQVGYGDAESGRITGAMIFIKAELQGLLRRSCIHEEFAQTLGLMNDDDDVRPSIFNDDQEFALLTEHDEYLLRILYDERLRPGMEAAEAAPIVAAIIQEMRPEGRGGLR